MQPGIRRRIVVSIAGVVATLLVVTTPPGGAAASPVNPAASCWSPWGAITLIQDGDGVMRPAAHRIMVNFGDFANPRPSLAFPAVFPSGIGEAGGLGIICASRFYTTIAAWSAALENFGLLPKVTTGPNDLTISLGERTLRLAVDQDHFVLGDTDPSAPGGIAHAVSEDLGYPALLAGHHLDSGTPGRTYAIPARVILHLDPRFHLSIVPGEPGVPSGFKVCFNSITTDGPRSWCGPDPALPPVAKPRPGGLN